MTLLHLLRLPRARAGRGSLYLSSAVLQASQSACYSTFSSGTLSPDNNGALKGIKVVDLSRVLAAPFCTQILADYGADITKIEAVGKGDDTRHWMTTGEKAAWNKSAGPISNYFSAVNRNKRSITINFKEEKGKQIVIDLIKEADVVVENFKPGTMDRLGLGYDVLKKHNPRIVYASISGYGRSGPFGGRGGYDPIAGAEAGLLHVTGERNGPPVRPGIGLVDMATGLYLHGAILAALMARERNGVGQRVDASLFETQISLLTNVGMSWLNLGIEAERWGCAHPSIAPYDAFKTKDSYLVCGATNDAQFATLCKTVGLEHLVDDEKFATNPQRVQNRDELSAHFSKAFATKTVEEWTELFKPSGLSFAPINNMQAAFAHPQIQARDMVAQIPMEAAAQGKINLIGPAVKFSGTKTGLRHGPPRLGQHTEEVLSEMGISAGTIEKYRKNGII